ncbi:hypothetical protein BH09BAC2_BH09BAC2_13810 [soil metagenome]
MINQRGTVRGFLLKKNIISIMEKIRLITIADMPKRMISSLRNGTLSIKTDPFLSFVPVSIHLKNTNSKNAILQMKV